MSVKIPNGTIVSIAASYGAEKTMSAVSNANPALATLESSHGVIDGDIIEVTSGWSRLTGRPVKASLVSSPGDTSVGLNGIDASSTTLYPAGSGTGTVREVATWTQLTQILDVATEGGEQKSLEYQFLEDDEEKSIPTSKSASRIKIQIADDPSLAGYLLALTANDDRLPRIVRFALPDGGKIYYNGYISLNKTPKVKQNELVTGEITISLIAQPTRYTS